MGDAGPAASAWARYGPAAGTSALYLLTIGLGAALAPEFLAAGFRAFEDPSSLGNTGLLIAEILVGTALILLALRYDLGELLVRVLLVGVVAYLPHLIVVVLLPASVPARTPIALGVAGLLGVVIWVYPEWYVLDVAAVVAGGAFVAQLGISLGPLPVVALLVGLAAYDAYSVYVSEHMQSLAGGVLDLGAPIVFVVPASLPFSLRSLEAPEEADASFLGLGDAVIPGLLVVSADTFLPGSAVALGLNAPAVGALIGAVVGIIGLQALLFLVRRAHAGLPVLNGAVLAGYLLGAAVAGVPIGTALGL